LSFDSQRNTAAEAMPAPTHLTRGIVGTCLVLAALYVGGLLAFGSLIGPKATTPLLPLVWVLPTAQSFTILSALAIAILCLARYRALDGAWVFWTGIVFLANAVLGVFYILAWPGLLGDHGVIAMLSNTSSWLFSITFSCLVLLPAAILAREPKTLSLGYAFAGYGGAIVTAALVGVLSVWFESALPIELADGRFTPLGLGWTALLAALAALGAVVAYRRFAAGEDPMLGYLALFLAMMAFALLATVTGGKRYDFWWYFGRVIMVAAYASLLFGFLREGYQLFGRERERMSEREHLLAEMEATLEAAPAAIITYDRQGRIVRFNEAAARIAGYTEADRLLPMEELFTRLQLETAEGQPMLLKDFPPARALRGEKVASVAMAFQRDGRKVWIIDGAGPIRARDDHILGAVVSFVDISDQKRAEEALRESEERYRTLFTQMEEGFALHEIICDEQGQPIDYRFLEANPAFQRYTGLQPQDVIGKTVREVLPGIEPFWIDTYGRVALTGEPTRFESYAQPLDRHYEVIAYSPRRGQFATLFVDITRRKHAEEERERLLVEMRLLADAAQRRAAELQGVLDNLVDAVFVTSPEGRITLHNQAANRLYGFSRFDEITNLSQDFPRLFQLRHPDGRPVKPEEMATGRALKGETVLEVSHIVRNLAQGRDRHVRVSSTPIRNAEGRIVGAVTIARDVTEIAELERMKDQFIAVAAHELKTPVTIMKGSAQILLRQAEGLSERQRKLLQSMNRGADRIDRVVNDLLDISRLHLGEIALERERIDLPSLVEQVVNETALTSGRTIKLIAQEPAPVVGDAERLEQVLSNLLDNAIKYSPQGGEIEVSVTRQNGQAVVAVRDHGVGIPKEKQQHIFERFYRAHTGTPYDYGGMGVGLYISKQIIERHGGRMWFESEEGKGSTFYFSLPLAT